MKKLLLALTLLSLPPRLATAQEAKTAVGAEKVTYSRVVPKGLRAFVPRGGKSRFWGATKLQFGGKRVWVHVYDVEDIDFSAKFDGKDYAPVYYWHFPESGVQRSGLDLWCQSEKLKWSRISSTRFEYLRKGNYDPYDLANQFPYNRDNEKERAWLAANKAAFETVGIQMLWLDVKSRTKPIIRVVFNSRADDSSNVWAVFSDGLNHKPVIQIFQNVDGGIEILKFDAFGVDQTGNVLVKYRHNRRDKLLQRWTLKWRGKDFVADGKSAAPLTPPPKSRNL